MLKFNKKGYLVPNKAIKSTVNELMNQFVVNYSSSKRSKLFNSYLDYCKDLKSVCEGIELKQWIDGSFVTLSKPNPSDIDLVTFIDEELVEKLGDKLKSFAHPNSKINYLGIDAYIVVVPRDKEKNFVFQSDKAYWRQQFDTTRRNRLGNKEQKGFLEIIY